MQTATPLADRFSAEQIHLVESDRQVNAARFSPCGEFLVAGGFEGEVRRWSITGDAPQELPKLEGHHAWVEGVAFDTSRNLLFSADSWGEIRAWNYRDEKPTTQWTVAEAHDGWIRRLAVSPDGTLLASCGRDQRIKLWNPADGKPVRELAGHDQDVFCIAFHPNGKWLLSGDARGIVKQWDLSSGECTRSFDASLLYLYHRIQDVGGVRALSLSPDGSLLAVGGTKPKNGGTVQGIPTLLVYDFESGELQHTLELGAANDCYVHEVLLHPAGFAMVVTCGTPGTGQLRFQQLDAKEPFFQFKKASNPHSLSLHPDGTRLALTATNKGSNGNGRRLGKDGEYAGNTSPIHVFELKAKEG